MLLIQKLKFNFQQQKKIKLVIYTLKVVIYILKVKKCNNNKLKMQKKKILKEMFLIMTVQISLLLNRFISKLNCNNKNNNHK